ncbi:hypothetical protein DFH07DRAFT_780559 [Mycena maculata]|uniref:Uncharacterized protein n=1 Tax=Mycena maculata TaxID=230809 RepID=A0AAD7I2Q7_9AGAR|nr:hypothetical protein DFH07DRAFT_780559 [Mycena maculata]
MAAWDNEGLSASFDVALEHSLPLALELWAFKLRRFIGGSILHWDRKLDLQNVLLTRDKGSNALSKDECAHRCFISEVFPVGTNTNILADLDKLTHHLDCQNVSLTCIKDPDAPSKDESTRRCFIDEGCPNWVNTKDALPSFIKGRGAPNKDESAWRGFPNWDEYETHNPDLQNVPLTCIKGPDAPSKDESACPCFIGEVFLIG